LNLLELMVALFSLGVVVLAFIDEEFRGTFEQVALLVIGGYLGNKLPDR